MNTEGIVQARWLGPKKSCDVTTSDGLLDEPAFISSLTYPDMQMVEVLPSGQQAGGIRERTRRESCVLQCMRRWASGTCRLEHGGGLQFSAPLVVNAEGAIHPPACSLSLLRKLSCAINQCCKSTGRGTELHKGTCCPCAWLYQGRRQEG